MIFTPDFQARLKLRGQAWLEIIKIGLIALAIVWPIRLFIICPFYVKGASMEPNFYDKEYLIIDEISYRFKQPERGEVIVFRYPEDPKEYFIKRIIGLPGETIKMDKGSIYLQDKSTNEWTKIVENYLPATDQTFSFDSDQVTLGADDYFVLGDNRENSRDSRYFGPLNRRYLTGRVLWRGWPLHRAQFFRAPVYSADPTDQTVKTFD